MKLKFIFILTVSFFIVIQAAAQVDNELWTGLNLESKIAKRTTLSLNNQLRLNNEYTSAKKCFTELSVSYKFNKYIYSSFRYRYTNRFQKKNRSRWTILINAKYKIKELKLTPSYRLRYQNEDQFNSNREINLLRQKFSLDYNLSKIVDPFVSYELFYQFNQINEYSNYRATFGLKWNLPNKWSMTTYFRVDKDIDVTPVAKSNIVGILFDKTLPSLRKK